MINNYSLQSSSIYICVLHILACFKLNSICALQFKSKIFAPWTQRQRHDWPSWWGRAQERYIADSNGKQVQDVQVLSWVRSTISGIRQILLWVRYQKARVVNIVLRALSLIIYIFDNWKNEPKKKILLERYALDKGIHTLIFYFESSFLELENTNIFRREKYIVICNFENILRHQESILKVLSDYRRWINCR